MTGDFYHDEGIPLLKVPPAHPQVGSSYNAWGLQGGKPIFAALAGITRCCSVAAAYSRGTRASDDVHGRQLQEQQQQHLRARMHHFREEAEALQPYNNWADAHFLPMPHARQSPSSLSEDPVLQTLPAAIPLSHQAQASFQGPEQIPQPPYDDVSSPAQEIARETKSKVLENGLPRLRYH